jgi:uncharacterized protein YjdB
MKCLFKEVRRFLSLMITTMLVMGAFTATAFAADEEPGSVYSSEQEAAGYQEILDTLEEKQPLPFGNKKDKVYTESSHKPQLNNTESYLGEAAAQTQKFNETEDNGDFSTANLIDNSFSGTTQYHVYGHIDNNYQDVDVYRFSVTTSGTVTVLGQWADKFAGLGWEDELKIGLFDSSQNIVAAADYNMLSDGSTARAFFADLSAGSYYMAVIQGDAYKSLFVGEKYRLVMDFKPSSVPSVIYQSHVETIGWQDWRINGSMSGTSGHALRLEAMRIQLKNSNGGIEYKTHVQNIGWQNWVADGALSGTSGRSLRLEAIKIRLTGEIASQYDIYYRVHAQNVGWMGWAKNGEASGTAGFSYRLEGIEIQLVAKGAAAPGSTQRAFVEPQVVRYQSHVQNVGWQGWKSNGEVSGTSGQSLRLEGMNIKLEGVDGGIEYRTHVQNIGWMDWVANGAMSGTSGRSLRLEAINIRLTGNWMGWAKNGEASGTAGFSYRLEAIQIQLVDKGGSAPGSTVNAFIQK